MKIELLESKALDNYPSGSGIEFYDDKVFLVGAGAGELLVMNKKWKKPGRIPLFTQEQQAAIGGQPDMEAMTLLNTDKKPHLFIVGSGAGPTGNKAILLNLKTLRDTEVIDLGVFYDRIRSSGLPELNMEAVALVYDYLVMVHGGTPANPDNYLVITKPGFWNDQANAPLQVVAIDFGAKAPKGISVSGITYSDFHEDLFLTINTPAGAAGGSSWLGVIENLYRKIGREKLRMKVNELIDLPSADNALKGYRFEAVCIQSEKDHSMKLQLIADNAAGQSHLFKVELGDL